jgi:hypothetical protein
VVSRFRKRREYWPAKFDQQAQQKSVLSKI